MAGASNVQTDFRGGEWSPAAQGRMDDRDFRRALNVCYNAMPTEAGSWTRRPGTRWAAYTRKGLYAWLITFAFATNAPYVMELTDSAMRFFAKGSFLVMTNDATAVSSANTANPVQVTLASAVTWATGDVVQFLFSPGTDVSNCGQILNRQFTVTKVSTTQFTLADSVTGATIDGSTFTLPAANVFMGRILTLATSYSQAQLPNVRSVQCEILSNNVLQGNVVLLHNAVAPQVVVNSTAENTAAFAQFTINSITFSDGPYFDPVNGTVSASGVSGTITLSAAPANTFVSTDVGRAVRLFSEPPAWSSGTTYAAGNVVKYTDGNYYTSLLGSNLNQPCNTALTYWAINPSAAQWQWGTIASYVSGTSVTVALNGTMPYSGTISTWRLGLYSATTGYPTCGCFHEGRLWLAGSQGNRFDGSNSNDPFNFAPTALDGTVGDANAISYIFNSNDVNPILWMEPDDNGIIAGTLGGEWVIQASALNDPLTPTSIQAHRRTKYKCANIPPVKAGLGLIFVKAQAKKLYEFVADVFSGRFMGRNISEKAAHMTGGSFAQVAYQQDLTPVVWARMGDGTLKGVTYKRESSFTSEPPTFAAWHQHALGSGCTFESMAAGPNSDGTVDTTYFSVLDPSTGYRHVEYFADQFPESATSGAQAWHVDGALPATASILNAAHTQVKFLGFTPYIGRTITLWVGGIDLGDYVVASDGSITTTFGTPALWTYAFYTSWAATATTSWDTETVNKTATTIAFTGIQGYIDTSVITTTDHNMLAYDRSRGYVIETGTSNNSTADGLKMFNVNTGATIATATVSQIFSGSTLATTDRYVSDPICIDPDYNIYWYSSTSNSGVLCRLSTVGGKFANLQTLGSDSNSSTTTANHVVAPSQLCAFKIAGNDYVVVSALVSSVGLSLINGSSMQFAGWTSGATITEPHQAICSGFTSLIGKASQCQVFAMGYYSTNTTNPLGFYTLTATANVGNLTIPPGSGSSATNASIAFSRGGSVTPANIDAAWTHITNTAGPVFDATDGNVIFWANTSDAVTHTNYVVKVNPATAAVVWATAVTGIPNGFTGDIGQGLVSTGKLLWMSGGTVYTCTTSSGAVSTTAITGFTQTVGQISDDANGGLIVWGQYLAQMGAPTQLNSTPSSFTGWAFLGSAATPPITIAIPSMPAIGGFTYTSKGQKLRPSEGPDAGTEKGPAFGKLRRSHWGMFQLALAQGIQIGTQFVDLTKMRTLTLSADGRNTNALNVLYTGVARQVIDDDYTLDGMVAWQVTRPYPAFVAAVGSAIHGQDF